MSKAILEPLDSKIFNENAEDLEVKRALARMDKKQITYDCLNSSLYYNKVTCRKGIKLSGKDGSMSSIACLRGVSAGACRNCQFYRKDNRE